MIGSPSAGLQREAAETGQPRTEHAIGWKMMVDGHQTTIDVSRVVMAHDNSCNT